MPNRFRRLTACFFVLGSALRLAIYAVNPALNSYDDHLEPVLLWMKSGGPLSADACWECHQPPFFYWLSALLGSVLREAGVALPRLLKVLQLVPCVAGILTLPVVLGILRRLRVSPLASCLAFGVICFLPRHIYMSALHSNDSLSYLLAALTVWLALVAIDRACAPSWLVALTLTLSAAVFTKLTALALLPALALAFGWLTVRRAAGATRPQVIRTFLLVFLLPTLLLSAYFVSNKRSHGALITDRQVLWDIDLTQKPGPGGVSFVSFVPWRAIRTPFLAPGYVDSFWTQIHGRTWFDLEPKFFCVASETDRWCSALYAYLDGVEGASWPGRGPHAVRQVVVGRALIGLGLAPLLLFCWGAVRSVARLGVSWRNGRSAEGAKILLLGALLVCNVAGIVAYTLVHPFYSSMKASYLLLSLPTYAVWVALGLSACESRKVVKWIAVAALFLLFALASVHAIQIGGILQASGGLPIDPQRVYGPEWSR